MADLDNPWLADWYGYALPQPLTDPAPLPDVRPREMREAPLGQGNLVHRALSSFGQPSLDALRRGYAGEATPQEVARTFLETGPVGPLGMARRGRTPAPPPAQESANALERPVQAAIRVGDKVFTGATHFDAMQAAVPRAVEQDLWGDALGRAFREAHGGTPEMDGFVTNTGRFVSREEATELARTVDGYRPGSLGRIFGDHGMDAVEYGRHLGRGREGLKKPD